MFSSTLFAESSSNGFIRLRRLGYSAGVVVGDDHGGGVVLRGFLHNLAGVDGGTMVPRNKASAAMKRWRLSGSAAKPWMVKRCGANGPAIEGWQRTALTARTEW